MQDLSATLQLLGRVLTRARGDCLPIPLSTGDNLHIGIGAEKTHVWISAAAAHLRIPVDSAHALLAALSEAKAHVTHAADAILGGRVERRGVGMSAMTVPAEIAALIVAGALFVVNHSGGKDSQAMFIRLLDSIPPSQLLVVMPPWVTLSGRARSNWRAIKLPPRASPSSLRTRSRRSLKWFEHRFAVRPGPNSPCWPSAVNRQCTSDLKRGPIQREVRRYSKEHGFRNIGDVHGAARPGEQRAREERGFPSQRRPVEFRCDLVRMAADPRHAAANRSSRRSAWQGRSRTGRTPPATIG